jgi:hypothetical protein
LSGEQSIAVVTPAVFSTRSLKAPRRSEKKSTKTLGGGLEKNSFPPELFFCQLAEPAQLNGRLL